MVDVNAYIIPTIFKFHIMDTLRKDWMNNISYSALPNFYGMIIADLDTFLFEFDMLCRIYDYIFNAYKLNRFLATLKEVTLWWFMGLGG